MPGYRAIGSCELHLGMSAQCGEAAVTIILHYFGYLSKTKPAIKNIDVDLLSICNHM